MPPHHDDEERGPPGRKPPPPPHHPPPHHHPGPPHAKPHWAAIDQLPDEEVLRYAPPEIRRLWRHVVGVEQQMGEVRESLRRIEDLLRARAERPDAPG